MNRHVFLTKALRIIKRKLSWHTFTPFLLSVVLLALTVTLIELQAAEENWSASQSVTLSTDIYEFGAQSKTYSSSYDLAVGKTFGTQSIVVSAGVNKELSGLREQGLGSLATAYSAKLAQPTKVITISTSLSASLPLESDTRKKSNSYFNMGASLPISFKLTELGVNGLTISYIPSVLRGFHKYKRAKSGAANIAWGFSNTLALGYSITDKISIGASAGVSQRFTYENNKKADQLVHGQKLAVKMNENWSLEMGHQNKANLFDATETQINVDLTSKTASAIYGTLTYSL